MSGKLEEQLSIQKVGTWADDEDESEDEQQPPPEPVAPPASSGGRGVQYNDRRDARTPYGGRGDFAYDPRARSDYPPDRSMGSRDNYGRPQGSGYMHREYAGNADDNGYYRGQQNQYRGNPKSRSQEQYGYGQQGMSSRPRYGDGGDGGGGDRGRNPMYDGRAPPPPPLDQGYRRSDGSSGGASSDRWTHAPMHPSSSAPAVNGAVAIDAASQPPPPACNKPKSNPFGAAKPVDTAAKLLEMEERDKVKRQEEAAKKAEEELKKKQAEEEARQQEEERVKAQEAELKRQEREAEQRMVAERKAREEQEEKVRRRTAEEFEEAELVRRKSLADQAAVDAISFATSVLGRQGSLLALKTEDSSSSLPELTAESPGSSAAARHENRRTSDRISDRAPRPQSGSTRGRGGRGLDNLHARGRMGHQTEPRVWKEKTGHHSGDGAGAGTLSEQGSAELGKGDSTGRRPSEEGTGGHENQRQGGIREPRGRGRGRGGQDRRRSSKADHPASVDAAAGDVDSKPGSEKAPEGGVAQEGGHGRSGTRRREGPRRTPAEGAESADRKHQDSTDRKYHDKKQPEPRGHPAELRPQVSKAVAAAAAAAAAAAKETEAQKLYKKLGQGSTKVTTKTDNMYDLLEGLGDE